MSEAQEQKMPKAKSPRWMRILLGVSLALNVAVVGIAAGAAYRVKERIGSKAPPPSLSVSLFRAMDRETRRRLMKDATAGHADVRAQREADRQALFSALQAEPFEVDAVADVLTKQAERQYHFREQLRQAWLEKLAEMPEDERMRLLERLQHEPPHRGKARDAPNR